MKIRLFTILIGASALLVASMAAFFSVYGIAKLFAGSLLPVAVMAGSLELAKLVIASFLYRYWKKVRWHLKTYFVAGILVLMTITSAGIIGYLTSSYQGTTVGLERQQTKLDFFQSEVTRLVQEKDRLQSDKQQLQYNLQQELSGLIITDTTRFLDVKRRNEAVQRYQPTINEKEKQIQDINKQILELQYQISELKEAMIDTGVDVGPLVYLSRVFGMSMDSVVRWYIFLIVFVFDPLAVALVIATNMSFYEDRKTDELVKKQKEEKQFLKKIDERIEELDEEAKKKKPEEILEDVGGKGYISTQTKENLNFLNNIQNTDISNKIKTEPKIALIDDKDIIDDVVIKIPSSTADKIVGNFVPPESHDLQILQTDIPAVEVTGIVEEKKELQKKNRFSSDVLYGKKEIQKEKKEEKLSTESYISEQPNYDHNEAVLPTNELGIKVKDKALEEIKSEQKVKEEIVEKQSVEVFEPKTEMPEREIGVVVGEFIPTGKSSEEKKEEISVEQNKKSALFEVVNKIFSKIQTPQEIKMKIKDKKQVVDNQHKFYYGDNRYEKFAEDKLKWLERNFEEADDMLDGDIPEPDVKNFVSEIIEVKESGNSMTEEEMRIEWDRIIQESIKDEEVYRTNN